MPPDIEKLPRIPDYELVKLIGRGGYGDVWLARSITGAFRAVKIVWRSRFEDSRPYLREFEGVTHFAAVSLGEPSQLALLHAGRDENEDLFYYVMELADDADTGRDITPERYVPLTLKERLVRRGRLPADEVTAVGVSLARALATLHAHGLVHRDIKPSNVIFVGGVPKLADIGLVAAASTGLTFVGTEGFVPPEGPGAPSADLYGLGKVLYEASTGLDRKEFPRLPANFGAFGKGTSFLELNEVILRACEPDSRRRFPDANSLLDELLLLQAGKSVRRLRSAERRMTRAIRIAAVLAAVAGVAGVGAWAERRRADQAEAQRDELARKSVYSAGVARAQRALELGDLNFARNQLQEIAPAPATAGIDGFEWAALWREAQGDPAKVFRESGPAGEQVLFSPDGRLLAVENSDDTATLFDTTTRKPGRSIPDVHRLAAFSPDGGWLVGTNRAFAFQRWSVATGEPDAKPAEGVNRPISALEGGRGLALQDGQPDRLRVWDFGRHAEIAAVPLSLEEPLEWHPYRFCIAANGSRCAVVMISGVSHLAHWRWSVFDVPSLRFESGQDCPARMSAVALTPDGARLACAFGDRGEVGLFSIADRSWLWRRQVGSSETTALQFSPDGGLLALAGDEPSIHIVSAGNGDLVRTFRGLGKEGTHIAWSGDGTGLAATDRLGGIRQFDLRAQSGTNHVAGLWAPPGGGPGICVSEGGEFVAATLDGNRICLFDAPSLNLAATLPRAAYPLGFSQGSLYSVSPEGLLQKWRRTASSWQLSEDPHPIALGTVNVANLSDDGTRLAAARIDGKLEFCDLASRTVFTAQSVSDGVYWWITASSDGSTVVTGGSDLRVSVWRRFGGLLETSWKAPRMVVSGALSPDLHWLALGLETGEVEIRSLPSLAIRRTIRPGGSSMAQAMTFSPASDRFVCSGPAGLLHIYATSDWREVAILSSFWPIVTGSETTIGRLEFARVGSLLAAYTLDGRLRVWRW